MIILLKDKREETRLLSAVFVDLSAACGTVWGKEQ